MVAAVRTPLHRSGSLALGQKRYRKEILTKGPLHVDGKIFDVTDDYLDAVIAAFNAQAIKSPPIKVADGSNTHTKDPFRRHGTVVGLHRTARGIDADLEPDDELQKLIDQYPDTGVSVLIEHDRTTGPGEHYPAALAHLLITEDPVINNLGGWALAASHEHAAGDVLDLLALSLAASDDKADDAPASGGQQLTINVPAGVTAEQIAEQITKQLARNEPATTTPDTEAAASADPSSDEGAHNPSEEESAVPDIDQLIADPAKLAELRNALAALDEQTPQDAPGDATSTDDTDTVPDPDTDGDTADEGEGEGESGGDTDDAIPTDEEIAAMLQTADDAATDTPAQVAASHTGDQADNALALANMSSQLEEMRLANEETSRKLAAAEWKTERDGWIHANIPPALIDKCEPFLNGASDKLALSNSGDKPKVAAALRTVLTEISKQAPSLGLGQGPIGTQAEIDEERQQAEADAQNRRQRASQVTAHLK